MTMTIPVAGIRNQMRTDLDPMLTVVTGRPDGGRRGTSDRGGDADIGVVPVPVTALCPGTLMGGKTSNRDMANDRLPRRLMWTLLSLGTVVALAAACGKSTETAATSTTGPSSQTPTTTTIVVDSNATPSGWVPVAFDDVQVSVPATWDITFGCPENMGNVYLGGIPKEFCPDATFPPDVVVIESDASAPPQGLSPETVNGLTAYRIGPDDGTVLIPSLHLSVNATGPSAGAVLDTVTYSPRAVVLTTGPSPAVPKSWHRLSFGGLSAAVPKTWTIDRQSGFPFGCLPIELTLGETGVILSAGTRGSVISCAAASYLPVPTPVDGLIIDPGPFGPIPAGASFGSCIPIHRLRACPTTVDRDGVLVLSVQLPGGRATTVEIGLAGSGLIARTILDSLEQSI